MMEYNANFELDEARSIKPPGKGYTGDQLFNITLGHIISSHTSSFVKKVLLIRRLCNIWTCDANAFFGEFYFSGEPWLRWDQSTYQGCSLLALKLLLERFKYSVVWCNKVTIHQMILSCSCFFCEYDPEPDYLTLRWTAWQSKIPN